MSTPVLCEKCKLPNESRHDLVVASMGLFNPVAYHQSCHDLVTEGRLITFKPTGSLNNENWPLIARFGYPVLVGMIVLDLIFVGYFSQFGQRLALIMAAALFIPTAIIFLGVRFIKTSVEKFENMIPEDPS